LKAILDEDGYFVTDDIRDLIAEVEKLVEVRKVLQEYGTDDVECRKEALCKIEEVLDETNNA
jgi:hypothetical protein